MASHAVATLSLTVAGLIYCSFPLHPPKKPGIERAAHLDAIEWPMLFISGTRDGLADPDLLTGVVQRLGTGARLHWLDTADHGYKILKRTRTSEIDVFDELAGVAAGFIRHHSPHSPSFTSCKEPAVRLRSVPQPQDPSACRTP